ncbi:MAG TPA: hypothetical protein VN966_01660 [Candidatus Bathyarchaeia archaeon]|nr:hypothetical protein [Candidatus Bathyarchaeia archaeon]
MQSKTGLLGRIEPSPRGALGSTSPCLDTLNHSWHYEKEHKDSQWHPAFDFGPHRRREENDALGGNKLSIGSNTSVLFLTRPDVI